MDCVEVLRLYTCRPFQYLLTTVKGRKSKFALLVAFNVLWYSLLIFFMYSACGTLLRGGGGEPFVGRFKVFLTYLPCSTGGWGEGTEMCEIEVYSFLVIIRMLCSTMNTPETYTHVLLTRYQEKWTDVTKTSNDQSIPLCFIENARRVADHWIQFQAYTDLNFIGRCNS